MELFKITLPMMQPVGAESMYYVTKNASPVWGKDRVEHIVADGGQSISLETYFNVFSYSKYQRYTVVRDVIIQLELKGEFQILVCARRQNGHEVIYSDKFHSDEKKVWEYTKDFSNEDVTVDGYYYVKLVSCADGGAFYGGRYMTNAKPVNNVLLAMDICTFKREHYVTRNIKAIVDTLIKSPESSVSNNIEILLVDNGQTLKGQIEENQYVHLFYNKNYGGSGGFTRGLMEAYYERERYTHVLLMDDDVIIDPHAIEKTINILKYIDENHKETHIAGGMLHFDKPCFQEEAGCDWRIWDINSHNKMTLRGSKALLENDRNTYPLYGGWWYLCVPISTITENNLPLPLFIKIDDIEYALRNGKELLVTNGIGVWHEAFNKKYSQHLEYFLARNEMIGATLHEDCTYMEYNRVTAFKHLFPRIMHNLLRHRYYSANVIIDGMEDYMKGVRYLVNQNEEQTLKNLLAAAPKLVTKEELKTQGYKVSMPAYMHSKDTEIPGHPKLWFPYAIISMLLPDSLYNKKVEIVDYITCQPRQFTRNKYVLHWNNYDQKGYVSEVDKKQFWQTLIRFFKVYMKLFVCLDMVKADYKKHIGKITSLEFWEKHLEIGDKNGRRK